LCGIGDTRLHLHNPNQDAVRFRRAGIARLDWQDARFVAHENDGHCIGHGGRHRFPDDLHRGLRIGFDRLCFNSPE
jgi:hypothetical protein